VRKDVGGQLFALLDKKQERGKKNEIKEGEKCEETRESTPAIWAREKKKNNLTG